jgi:lysophospholipase L1-like esterase
VRPRQNKTSCAEVAYIGDSISLGMVSATTPQRPTAEFEKLMAEVGVTDLQVEVSGGRSIVETLPGQENAVTVAQRLRDAGFAGCWVIAIGTNDAANIAAGAARQADERVVAIMSVVGSDPVLWIDAASVATSGYWAVPNVEAWDRVLAADIASYPGARIAPWSGYVRSEWFESDGIHITAAGAAARAKFVANALAVGFPLT